VNSATPDPLDYATPSPRRRQSTYGWLAITMAVVSIGWLGYVQFARPRYHEGGPLWRALWQSYWLPGGIGLALALAGLVQEGRKRSASILAIILIVLAYFLLPPPNNFA
jgi:hypothetical protein